MNTVTVDYTNFAARPNVLIVPGDGLLRDCETCDGFQQATRLAYAPSLSAQGYRTSPVCAPCARRYVADGIAVEQTN